MMSLLPLASIWHAQIWYAVPLIVVISVVYGATRHEHLKEIVGHTLRAAIWLVVFLGVIFALVWWANTRV
ncbi:MAG: hypothetical protein ACR2NP_01625 [Pirellulaceae bacterium]